MKRWISRRRILTAAPAAVGGLLVESASRANGEEAPSAGISLLYPTQDPDVVREVVARSHVSFDGVRELVEPRPELSRATWDWGFGDWESALGAASHMGRRDIADYLVSKGARPDLFTFAMLGHLDVVRAFVAARPGIQRLPGPHGITLLAHARAGGAPAAAVVSFLENLGGADEGPVDLPLEEDGRKALLGIYTFGPSDVDRFEVTVDRQGKLALRRAGGVSRVLFHQGEWQFHPAGAPTARVRFVRRGGTVTGLEITNPELVLRADRS